MKVASNLVEPLIEVTKIFSDNTSESNKKVAIEIINTLPLEDLEIYEKLIGEKTPNEIIKIIIDNHKSRPTSTTKTATATKIFSDTTFESKKQTTIIIINFHNKTTAKTSLNNTTLSQTNGSENNKLIFSIIGIHYFYFSFNCIIHIVSTYN
jgi:hypothetical protein